MGNIEEYYKKLDEDKFLEFEAQHKIDAEERKKFEESDKNDFEKLSVIIEESIDATIDSVQASPPKNFSWLKFAGCTPIVGWRLHHCSRNYNKYSYYLLSDKRIVLYNSRNDEVTVHVPSNIREMEELYNNILIFARCSAKVRIKRSWKIKKYIYDNMIYDYLFLNFFK